MVWTSQPKIPQKIRKQLAKYDDITAQLLFNRGLTKDKDIEKFFNPLLSDLPDYRVFSNIDDAVKRILEARRNNEKIVIYGDYDVDGVCSTSILFDFLYRKLETNVIPYIPSRFDEGYGLSIESLSKIKSDGATLIITVDCGIRDGELLKEFAGQGVDVIITDHHQLPEQVDLELLLKHSKAVVHPEFSVLEDKTICATTVVWYLVRALSEQAFKSNPESSLSEDEYLDLVALGTVCDIMPLVGQNRIFLKYGIEKMRSTTNVGLTELIDVAGIQIDEIEPYHLGFVLGPRLNAAGRLESALDAVRLLTTQSKSKARSLAIELSDLNTQRQELTKQLMDDAELKIDALGKEKKLYFIVGDNWPEGIVGLVAGKLTEKYNKPVLVGSSINGKTTGSARSIKGFHVTNAISKSSKILTRFGGHSQAAGFTLEIKHLDAFSNNLLNEAENSITDDMLLKQIQIDADIKVADLKFDLIYDIEKFAPFGYMNKKPVFRIDTVTIKEKRLIGSNRDHIKLVVGDAEQSVEVIGFGKSDIFNVFRHGEKVRLVGNLGINNFMNQQIIQINLIDIKSAHERD